MKTNRSSARPAKPSTALSAREWMPWRSGPSWRSSRRTEPMAARACFAPSPDLKLSLLASFPRTRALTWQDRALYASSGYQLRRVDFDPQNGFVSSHVAEYHPGPLRSLTSRSRLASRFLRDGFHALTVLSSGHLIAAVPHAIVRLEP